MADTAILQIPEIEESQGSKYFTHNEALRGLEQWLGQIKSRTADIPGSPSEGDTHIVPASPSGEWQGHVDELAHYYGGAWHYAAPVAGPLLQVEDEGDARVYYDGSAWVTFSGGGSLPQSNDSATTDPTVNDDSSQGYEIGSRWINTSTGELWRCIDATAGAAVWVNTSLELDELGSAAAQDVGTAVGDVPQLEDVGGGTPGMPAVDGSQLTGVTASGSVLAMPVKTLTADYTVQTGDAGYQLAVTDTTAARTVTLPPAATAGSSFTVATYLQDATNSVTVTGDGSETIDGAADVTLSAGGDGTLLVCDGTQWRTAADAITPTGAGTGDVTGPASSTDNELARYDGTGGKALQGSGVRIDDDGNLYGHGQRVEQRGADFTLAAADAGKTHECASGSAFTITIPANSTVSLPVGYSIAVVQADGNAVTVSPASGVTLRSRSSNTSTAGQWAAATLYQRAADEWVLIGDLA